MNGLGLGLLNIDFDSTAEQVDQQQQGQIEDYKRKSFEDSLGSLLYGRFTEWRDARREKEEEWLEDLRAYNGIYEQDIKAKIAEGRSDVYVHLTRTKVLSAYTRIVDLLFQSSDRHWSIDPTPVPEGDMFVDAWGRPLHREMVVEYAKKVADLMETEMADQLEEQGYEPAMKQAIAEACILGSGAVKGITVGVEHESNWQPLPNGWAVITSEKPVPGIGPVSIFDLYPEPYALELPDAEGVFQRHSLIRTQFRELATRFKFDPDAVDDVLRNNERGNYTQEHHEIERRRIAGFNTEIGSSKRLEVLEYWGYVSGRELQACGCDVEDEAMDYQANVWICGSRTLLARLNPSRPEKVPYQIFPYERVPHQFWGTGVPRQMMDSQETMNAAVRAMLDNLAISSGPMLEMNQDLLKPGEDPLDIHPWKVFLREGGDPSYPLIRYYQPTNVTQNLGQVVDMFRRFADEETSLPSYTHGAHMPGLNKTASGMSMLMGAANISIKGIIKNIDDYLVKPLIKALYDWNMKWNSREDIKGDMNIVARGSTTLVAKEVQSQRLIQFLQMTANPVDAQLVDRLALLREVAEALDIDARKVIRDEHTFSQPPQAIDGRGLPQQGPDAAGGPGGQQPLDDGGLGLPGAIPGQAAAAGAEGVGNYYAGP